MGFPIHARFAHPDYGLELEGRQATELLTVGEVYTVNGIQVGQSSSYLNFREVPGEWFNTVLFEGVDSFAMDGDEAEEVSMSEPTLAERLAASLAEQQDRDAEASRERSLAATKLDECEMWLAKCEPTDEAKASGQAAPAPH